MTTSELLAWLEGQLSEARRKLQAREESAETWSGGTEADWKAGVKVASQMSGRPVKAVSKSERLKDAAIDRRIAEKIRRDVVAIEELIAMIDALPPVGS